MSRGEPIGERHRRLLLISSAAFTTVLFIYCPLRGFGIIEGKPVMVFLGMAVACAVLPVMLAFVFRVHRQGWGGPPFPSQPAGAECCINCGYPVANLPVRQCPECGGRSFIVNKVGKSTWVGEVLAGAAIGFAAGVLAAEVMVLFW